MLGSRVRWRKDVRLPRMGRNLGSLVELRWSLCCERRWRRGPLAESAAEESAHHPVRPVRGPRRFLAYSLGRFLLRELSLGSPGGRALKGPSAAQKSRVDDQGCRDTHWWGGCGWQSHGGRSLSQHGRERLLNSWYSPENLECSFRSLSSFKVTSMRIFLSSLLFPRDEDKAGSAPHL